MVVVASYNSMVHIHKAIINKQLKYSRPPTNSVWWNVCLCSYIFSIMTKKTLIHESNHRHWYYHLTIIIIKRTLPFPYNQIHSIIITSSLKSLQPQHHINYSFFQCFIIVDSIICMRIIIIMMMTITLSSTALLFFFLASISFEIFK